MRIRFAVLASFLLTAELAPQAKCGPPPTLVVQGGRFMNNGDTLNCCLRSLSCLFA
jgi:hypothetical protein